MTLQRLSEIGSRVAAALALLEEEFGDDDCLILGGVIVANFRDGAHRADTCIYIPEHVLLDGAVAGYKAMANGAQVMREAASRKQTIPFRTSIIREGESNASGDRPGDARDGDGGD